MNEQLRMAIPVLWPAMAVAGAIMLVAWWPRHRPGAMPTVQSGAVPHTVPYRSWASALAAGLAFATSFCIIVGGLPAFPLREKWHWLLPIAAVAAAFAVIAGIARRTALARWALWLLIASALLAALGMIFGALPRLRAIDQWTANWPANWPWSATAVVLGGLLALAAGTLNWPVTARWIAGVSSAAAVGLMFHPLASIEQPQWWRAGVAALTLLSWSCADASARRFRGFATPLLYSMLFAGLSIVILQGRNANISLLAASISAALGAMCLIGMLLPPLSLAGGATYVLGGLLAAMLAIASMYGIGTPASLAILAATPLLLRGGEWLFPRAAGWKSFVLRLLCTAIPVAAAVVIAMIKAAKTTDEFTP